MAHIFADEPLVAWLRGIVEPVEVRDLNGKVMGHYTPALSPETEEVFAQVRAMIDSGELDRRCEAEGGKGTPIAPLLATFRARLAQEPQG